MKALTLVKSLIIFFISVHFAIAHSGGLNADGCHAGSKPYHCHRKQQKSLSITKEGFAQSSECHPSYAGACLPMSSDVDCGGGGGDGPVYLWQAVRVIGPDIYKLDGNRDGWACEQHR